MKIQKNYNMKTKDNENMPTLKMHLQKYRDKEI